MFKFFKDKIKKWIGKSKEEIEEKVEEQLEEEKAEKEVKKEIREKEVKEEFKEKQERKEREKELETIERSAPTPEEVEQEIKVEKKPGIFQKIIKSFSYKISEEDFNEIFENLEFLLLENNVALEAVDEIKKQLKHELLNKEIKKQDLEKEIQEALKKAISNLLIEPDNLPELIKVKSPFIIVFFGINGTGKTTTIAKVANYLKQHKISCVLAAADTFRAASIEQLEKHAQNLNLKLIKHDYGSDPAAVAFDAIKHAKAHNVPVVLIDTAGRMHTQSNLLNEMEKICRVTNPDLKIFVAESIAGNDAVEQAKSFHKTIGIDSSILTKADVDEKGGTAISISYATKRPIQFLGTGQKYTDLELFDKEKFIKQLGL